MSKAGVKLAAQAFSTLQSVKGQLIAMGAEAPHTKSGQQDIRLGQLLDKANDAVKEQFAEITLEGIGIDHAPGLDLFTVGDAVQWTSQAGGYTKTKSGIIVAVVPAKESALNRIPEGFIKPAPQTVGGYRDHESYLVQVGRQRRLYWPRVANLERT